MLLKYITLASGFNFLLLALVLLIKKAPNKNANNIMGVLFLLISVYSYIVSSRFSSIVEGNYSQLKYYTANDGVFLLLMGPCIYLFICSVLNKPIKIIKWINLIHIIPFIPFLVFNIYFATLPFPERINWFIRDFAEGTIENNMLNVVLYIQMPYYLFISYSLIKAKFKESTVIHVSGMQIDISWIKTFLTINIIYLLFSAPLCFYLANERANIIIGSIGMDIQFIYLFIKAVWQKDIITEENYKTRLKSGHVLKIEDHLAEDYLNTLDTYIKKEKPFLLEDCSLQIIADNTGVTVHQLSNIINNKLNKNFSDYINEYRIEESKRILNSEESDKLTIEAIGYNCGFGSKSSFNKVFKKYINLTPTEFRQKSRQNQN